MKIRQLGPPARFTLTILNISLQEIVGKLGSPAFLIVFLIYQQKSCKVWNIFFITISDI